MEFVMLNENLTFATASNLLQEWGYKSIERFGHLHAIVTRTNGLVDERHLCLCIDLSNMTSMDLKSLARNVFNMPSFEPKMS